MSESSLCVVAGEPSGDLNGAILTREIRRLAPDCKVWGVGSDRLADAGCELWQDARDWGIIGFSAVLRSIRLFRERLRSLADEIARRQPSAVILIDYPGFNLRLAPMVKKLGIPVIYYIVPQIWAWGRGRIKVFKRHVDHAIVVLPFEESFFRERGATAHWVGHPLVDLAKPTAPRDALRGRFGINEGEALVTMLPGARLSDFDSHLPIFTGALAKLKETLPGIRAGLGLAPDLADQMGRVGSAAHDLIISSDVYDLIAASDLVLTKTGTTTVECALLGTPMVTGYRMSTFNYLIARSLVRIDYIGLPNLIAQAPIVPELVQSDLNVNRVTDEATRLLTDREARLAQLRDLAGVRAQLGEPGAAARAAGLIAEWTQIRR